MLVQVDQLTIVKWDFSNMCCFISDSKSRFEKFLSDMEMGKPSAVVVSGEKA